MPRGVYIRTKEYKEKLKKAHTGKIFSPEHRKAISKSRLSSPKARKQFKRVQSLPRSQKQIEASRRNVMKGHKLPRTLTQLEAARQSGLNRKGKLNPHKGRVFGPGVRRGDMMPEDYAISTCDKSGEKFPLIQALSFMKA